MKSILKGFPKWALVTIIVVAVVAICVSVVALVISSALSQDQDSRRFSGPSTPYIARISVVGEISGVSNRFASSNSAYHHSWTLQTIDTLIADSYNKGICLWLDTPGGAVYESDELYLKLMEYKEKTGRPIYAYMKKIAASGGYYVASSADEVFANRNAWTGSIGVSIGTMFDYSEFLEEHGIRTVTIVSGNNKAMGNKYEPLTDEQKAIYQSLVDDAYGRFVDIVAKGRGMTDAEARKVADGRLLTAGQALDSGLIDDIMGERDAEQKIMALVDGSPAIHDCYYRPSTNYFSLFGTALYEGQGLLNRDRVYEGDVAAVLELARQQEEAGIPPIKYLYEGW